MKLFLSRLRLKKRLKRLSSQLKPSMTVASETSTRYPDAIVQALGYPRDPVSLKLYEAIDLAG